MLMMMMDTHFSQKEETRKIKTGRKREKETKARAQRDENLFFCAQKKKRVACFYLYYSYLFYETF